MTAKDSQALLDKLIGRPYIPGGQGPDSFDCWGLVRYFYREMYGVTLYDFSHIHARDLKSASAEIDKVTNSHLWTPLEKPEPGCIVAMSRSRVLHHVGVWVDIDGGLCLHALDGAAVVAQTVQRLRQERFSKILFFKYGPGI